MVVKLKPTKPMTIGDIFCMPEKDFERHIKKKPVEVYSCTLKEVDGYPTKLSITYKDGVSQFRLSVGDAKKTGGYLAINVDNDYWHTPYVIRSYLALPEATQEKLETYVKADAILRLALIEVPAVLDVCCPFSGCCLRELIIGDTALDTLNIKAEPRMVDFEHRVKVSHSAASHLTGSLCHQLFGEVFEAGLVKSQDMARERLTLALGLEYNAEVNSMPTYEFFRMMLWIDSKELLWSIVGMLADILEGSMNRDLSIPTFVKYAARCSDADLSLLWQVVYNADELYVNDIMKFVGDRAC